MAYNNSRWDIPPARHLVILLFFLKNPSRLRLQQFARKYIIVKQF